MPTEAVRPSSVPEGAVFREEEGHWELPSFDERGRTIGPVTFWAADGRLLMRAHYVDGVLHGPFQRFHSDGGVAREGRYERGSIEGEVWAHAGRTQQDEPLRGCCVPQGAARMRARYESGALMGETFYDAEGFVLLSNGARRPPRPPTLAEAAQYDEGSGRWVCSEGSRHSPETSGTWSYWRQDGSLSEEADFRGGHRVATRHFDEAGELKEAIGLWVHDGFEAIPHGAWRRRLHESERAAWSVPASTGAVDGAAWLTGHFDQGHSVGTWSVSVGEAVVWRRELGASPKQEELLASLEHVGEDRHERATGKSLIAVAHSLRESGQVRYALVALARAVGRGEPAEIFVDAHAAWALPKPSATAEQEAQRLADGEKSRHLPDLLDALVTGARAPDVLRLLAAALPPWSRAARDLVEASLALEPEGLQSLLTRALVCIDSADDPRAEEDIQRLAAVSQGTADLLSATLRILRPSFAFVPGTVPLPPLPEPVPLEPAQPLECVQQVARVYASRLLQLREALARFSAADAGWAPPDLSSWLPEGPVSLQQYEADIDDEDDEGQAEVTTVRVDETLDVGDLGVGAIMRRARADWAGLCWLLWGAGQDQVAWPRALQPCPAYAEALNLAIERAWRARDQVATSGLRSMTQGLASFSWEGFDVAELPANLLDVCVDEFIEMRAVLLWLSNAGNISPFQSDLRQP